MPDPKLHDAIVCGGGAAGLAAALWLGRYRRKTLVLDAGEQRNQAAEQSHGYLTRDGASPAEMFELARRDLARYETVEVVAATAESARREGDRFVVGAGTEEHSARRLILCTGVEDEFPDLPGFRELYGTAIFHCPACDGFEARDQDVLAIGWGEHVSGYSLDLLEWGARVTVVTNGHAFEGDDACSVALRKHDVEVIEEAVTGFEFDGREMKGARVESGRLLPAALAFFSIAHHPRTDLAKQLGCEIDDLGYVKIDAKGETNIDGVYAAGDVTPGEQLVQIAAGQGAVAGIDCAISLRGTDPAPGAPTPGPDPEKELQAARAEVSS